MVAGADPHFPYLRERGALGRTVGRFGKGDTRACGGVCSHGAVVADGDGNVFGVVGGRRDVGRVWFYVEAHEHGVVDVTVLLESNDACALEDAVNPRGCVEKNGGPVSFDERLADVEARYGVGSRQAVDVGAMLSVLRRELEMRGVSVEAAERAGVERVDAVGESAGLVEGAAGADVADAEDVADSL